MIARVRPPLFVALVLGCVAFAFTPAQPPEGESLVDIATDQYRNWEFERAAMTLDLAVASDIYDDETEQLLVLRAGLYREVGVRFTLVRDAHVSRGEKVQHIRVARNLDLLLGDWHRILWSSLYETYSRERILYCGFGD